MVGTLVRGYSCATSWSDLDLTFDLGIVTLTYKILSGLYLGNRRNFSLLINAVILLLNYLVLILHLYMHDLSFKHYLDLYITDSALKVS